VRHDLVKEKGGAAMRQGIARFTGAQWMMVATVLLFVGGVSAQEADKKPAQEADGNHGQNWGGWRQKDQQSRYHENEEAKGRYCQ
jgi:hypothetical protein